MALRRIFKYTLPDWGLNVIKVPHKYKILSVQSQRGVVTLWAEVDPNAAETDVELYVYPTGGSTAGDMYEEYIATVQTSTTIVRHIYKVT